jgi:SAM-dependent methyltransferase
VLDVGSGVGGIARFLASKYGCRITGIDITEEFVEASRELTARCRLADLVEFHQGDALAMPFADESFDAACCISVAVNIADKAGLLAEIGRVLKPGARLVWSEGTEGPNGAPYFPLPCARHPSDASLTTPEALRMVFDRSPFRIVEWTDETAANKAWVEWVKAAGLPARKSNAVVLGSDFSERARNYNRSVDDGRLIPLLVVAEKT